MGELKYAVIGFFAIIAGIIMFINAGSFIPSTGGCYGPEYLYGSGLGIAMGYEFAVGLLFFGGLVLLLSNLGAGHNASSGFLIIVIIAIAALISLFAGLGVFSPAAMCGAQCVADSGFFCQSPIINVNGNLSLTFGQSTGESFYNIGFACAASADSNGLPLPEYSMVYLSSSGNSTAQLANPHYAGPLNLTSGGTTQITGLKCFDNNGNPLAQGSNTAYIGTTFFGSVWINYTLDPTAPGAANRMLTQKVATIGLKVT